MERRLKEDRARLVLPPGVIRRRIADAHSLLGEEMLKDANLAGSTQHLARALFLRPRLRPAMLLAFSLFPFGLFQLAQHLKRRVLAKLSAARGAASRTVH